MEKQKIARSSAIAIGCAIVFLAAGVCHATITYGLEVIEPTIDSSWATASGLDLTVQVSDLGSQVGFKFVNGSSFACSMTQIYFDDDARTLLGIDQIDWGSQEGVKFRQGTVNGKLPGGKKLTPRLEASSPKFYFSARPAPPISKNGINPGEWLSFLFDLKCDKTYSDVISAFDSDKLRIGVHVQAFPDGSSASYVTPEPASIALLGLGTIMLRRRKGNS
jgi:hypothetical protein